MNNSRSASFGQSWLVFNGAALFKGIYADLLADSANKAGRIARLLPILKEIHLALLAEQANAPDDSLLQTFTQFATRAALASQLFRRAKEAAASIRLVFMANPCVSPLRPQAIQEFEALNDIGSKALPFLSMPARRAFLGSLLQDMMRLNVNQPVLCRILKVPLGGGPGDRPSASEKFEKHKGSRNTPPPQEPAAPAAAEKLSPDVRVLLHLEVRLATGERSSFARVCLRLRRAALCVSCWRSECRRPFWKRIRR